MPSKGKDKKKGKSKGKDTKKLIKTDESVVDRAKANASLWEARLEVTELSRIKYRDTSRILAKSNEDLKKKQCKMEKDIMSVLSYLKKQDQEKDNMIEKLKQQLNETKEKAQEEKDKLEQKYTRQINELEGQFHQKAKEIGMIHTELKAVRQFQKRKIQVERELDDLKENLRNTERIHQETLRRLESRFFEEKHRLEQEAEKKIIMLAERAHHEAIVTHIEGNVDIGDLTWEQKEKVLRLLFAKMNGCPSRKYNQSSRPPVPDYVVSDSGETKEFGDESKLQDKIFITQQIPISDSSGKVVLPTIPKGPQESDTGTF
nr:basal body-orientation factor 1 isoform X4 [Gorilla gorilla gorilla]